MALGRTALALLALSAPAQGAPAAEEVLELPLYGKPPSRQWSGFLDASAAEPGTMLHYWFAEAEVSNPESMPVVLWLNGGPGSSSIMGMLQEHGPLLINATGGLMHNPYSWTKQANVLILESPAGVGYSFCAAMKTGGGCNNTDVTTAKAAAAALRDFFVQKFPELQPNKFYITGESYAGVYIPTLASELLRTVPEVNLKGVGVGDPCTDNKAQHDSMDMVWYAHKYGFMTDEDFDLLWNKCSVRHPNFMSRGRWHRVAGEWAPSRPVLEHDGKATSKECVAAHRRFLLASSNGFSQGWPLAWVNDLTLYGPAATLNWDVPGTLNYHTGKWMNDPAVKKALHVESAPVSQWPGPNDKWQYTSVYAACNPDAAPDARSMIDFYREIAPKLERTVVFNGDTDPCVSYEGTRTAIQRVGFSELEGCQYRPWFYQHKQATLKTLTEKPGLFGPDLSLVDTGVQFGGHVVDYEHNLSFVTVHGSGHMVPQFRPQAAEILLMRLLSGTAFAPPLPKNADLEVMTEGDFAKAMDAWTKGAEDAAPVAVGHEPVSGETWQLPAGSRSVIV